MHSSMLKTFAFIKTIEQLAMQMKYSPKVMFDEVKTSQPLMLTKNSVGLYSDEEESELASNQYYIVHMCDLSPMHHDIIAIYGSEDVLITYTVDDEEGDFITIESVYEGYPEIDIDCNGNIHWTLEGR